MVYPITQGDHKKRATGYVNEPDLQIDERAELGEMFVDLCDVVHVGGNASQFQRCVRRVLLLIGPRRTSWKNASHGCRNTS